MRPRVASGRLRANTAFGLRAGPDRMSRATFRGAGIGARIARMATVSPPETRITSEAYLDLVARGVLGPEDKVELLEGVIVAMAPSGPLHASVVNRLQYRLHDALRGRACVRGQSSMLAGVWSVPEPDVGVFPLDAAEYEQAHPDAALLIVEVALSSLPQDRLTKSRIYAAAGVPEYWIVNLRDDVLEVHRGADRPGARYAEQATLGRGDRVALLAFPDVELEVAEVLPLEPGPPRTAP
jgi:Uma2 family endonuclease